MTQIINIAAYKFVGLADLEQRKAEVLLQAQALALKGTVLLTSEGINLFLAGSQAGIEGFFGVVAHGCGFRRFGSEVQ